MKKLVALFLCVIVAFPVFAKNDKDRNEFSITYGQYTIPQFAYVMGGVLGAAFTGAWSMCIMSMTGSASAGRRCATI